MEHTPWEACEVQCWIEHGDPFNAWLVMDARGYTLADCGEGKVGKQRAESIARCANAHDALVTALQASALWVNEYLDAHFDGEQKRTVYMGKARSIVDLDNEITIALDQLEVSDGTT